MTEQERADHRRKQAKLRERRQRAQLAQRKPVRTKMLIVGEQIVPLPPNFNAARSTLLGLGVGASALDVSVGKELPAPALLILSKVGC